MLLLVTIQFRQGVSKEDNQAAARLLLARLQTPNPGNKILQAVADVGGGQVHVLVDAKPQGIVHAEAFGNGQDSGHVAPMLKGAKANVQALGLGEEYFAGQSLSADSNSHSDENLQTCAQAQLAAYMPDNQFRQREPRFPPQEPLGPPTEEKFTVADFPGAPEQGGYRCPAGKGLKLKAQQHRIKHLLYSRYEAQEADCRGCALREKCLQSSETRRKHLAVLLGKMEETLSEKMRAKIDTPEARAIYGQRLASVEPVFGNLRSQKRLDRLTLRGKVKVSIQWLLYCMVHNIEKILHSGGAVERWGQGGLHRA
jgi:hypothetical protein